MYFCNMLGEGYVKSYNNGKVTISKTEVSEGFLGIDDKGNVVNVDSNSTNTNLFGSGIIVDKEKLEELYRVGKPTGKKGNITYKMIQDTEENPLIIVLCKEISFFEGIEADIRFINLDDDCILACLVSGVCAFDGTPMQRCNTVNFMGKNMIKFNSKQLSDFTVKMYTDKETGYVYNKDVLCSICVVMMDDKNFNAKKVGTTFILDNTGLDKAKKVLEERKAKAIALEEKKQEERQQYLDSIKEKEEREAREKAEKEEREALAAASVGAMDFLKAVAALNGGN